MTDKTSISWTDSTWNPHYGCIKISPGCKNCYMYRDMNRYGLNPKSVTRASDATFYAPLTKKRFGPLIFTCSWSDWFIDEADGWRDDAWDVIRQCKTKRPERVFQILTKRPDNIVRHLPDDWDNGWDNVWLGVSVESTQYLPRISTLAEIPAHLRFVSYEPALESVDFRNHMQSIDWLIAGGESGPNHRKCDKSWLRAVRDDCKNNGVPFFLKQHGGTKKVDGEWGGCTLDGQQHKEFPDVAKGGRK